MRLTGPKISFALDLRALAVFRIGLAVLLLIDLCMRSRDLSAHYTNFGILPVSPYTEFFANRLHTSLHLANGEFWWQAVLFLLTGVAALAVACGYRTRLATVISWVLLVSMHNRNTMILNGGDVLFRLLWFWAMFLPLNARYSVDAALSPERQPTDNRYFGGPSIAYVGQILCIYLATASLKTGKEWWPDGTASYYALSLDQFTTSFGVWLLQWYELLHYSTYIVYFLEVGAAFLLVSPFFFPAVRTLTILALMFMHLNFDLTMRLGIFPWVDIVSLIPLLPTEVWDRIGRYFKSAARLDLKIYYDRDCGFCKKVVLLLREFLLVPETFVGPAQDDKAAGKLLEDNRSWVVEDSAGVHHLKFDALATVLEHAPVLGEVAKRLPIRAVQGFGDRIYDLVADCRPTLGRLTTTLLPYRDLPAPRATWLLNFITLFFLGYVALWNMKTIPRLGIRILPPWDKIGPILRLDQTWNMFAPYPLKDDGWYVIDGALRDGSKVDVLAFEERPASYDKPALVSAQHTNARWRKFMMNINSKKKKDYRLYYGKYLCRAWNLDRAYERQLQTFDLVFMKEKTLPVGVPQTAEKIILWRHDCFKKKEEAATVETAPSPEAEASPTPEATPAAEETPPASDDE